MYSDLVLVASAAKCYTLAGGGRGGRMRSPRGTCGQTIGRSRAENRSDADAQLLARSQRYRRSSRVGQVWRGSTSVSLMREGGVREPQGLNWNSRSTAILRTIDCARETRALTMVLTWKIDGYHERRRW
ncbi:hypothetical protein BDW68DRAFT_186857 [Aspergillus falconensis]